MSKRRITIYDLARELNLSAATVSRALGDDPRVKESTRQKVITLSERWKYQPNHIATALRKGRSKILGVIIPTSKSGVFSTVIHGVEEVANRAGYSVLVGQSHESYDKEKKSLQTFVRARTDGILVSVARGTRTSDHFQSILQHDIPIVFFDRVMENLTSSTVEINDHAAAVSAVTHLIEQGYRRIAHVAGPEHIRIYRNRLLGYEDGLRRAGLSVDPTLKVISDLSLEDGKRIASSLMQQCDPPDAFFSASDDAAIGALQYLKENGYQVPERVGVIGFANKEFTPYLSPALSSFDQRYDEMGRRAAELLLDEIKTERSQRQSKRIVLEGNLIIRDSSLRNNGYPMG